MRKETAATVRQAGLSVYKKWAIEQWQLPTSGHVIIPLVWNITDGTRLNKKTGWLQMVVRSQKAVVANSCLFPCDFYHALASAHLGGIEAGHIYKGSLSKWGAAHPSSDQKKRDPIILAFFNVIYLVHWCSDHREGITSEWPNRRGFCITLINSEWIVLWLPRLANWN